MINYILLLRIFLFCLLVSFLLNFLLDYFYQEGADTRKVVVSALMAGLIVYGYRVRKLAGK